MKFVPEINQFFRKPFFSNYKTVFWLWVLLAIIAWLTKYFPESYNNFLIFKYVYIHTIDLEPLYTLNPDEYFDLNHYGPFFSLIIAPFAIMPLWAGLLTWLVSLSLFLYIATRKLPFTRRQHLFIFWFCAHELLTALFMSQFNIAIAAIIILTFICIEKEKDIWAAFFIMLGTFVKLYGIVGLAFFFFSKHKVKFVAACIGWACIMFVAPVCISNLHYVIEQYKGWLIELTAKNEANLFARLQNISLLGILRKVSGNPSYSDIYPILAGLAIFALPYLRIKQYKHEAFRQALLASVLMFVVLFSTGSESSTYIIAFMGVAIWYVTSPWKRSRLDVFLMVFAFILTSMSPSDLFPAYIRREIVQPYALKALPCAIIWLKLSYEMCVKDYRNIQEKPAEV